LYENADMPYKIDKLPGLDWLQYFIDYAHQNNIKVSLPFGG